MVGRTENGIAYGYGYDKRGNLTEERCGDSLIRQYTYDVTNHLVLGKNLENGEKTEYSYNGLYMRVKNVQTLRPDGWYGQAGQAGTNQNAFLTRETSYVTDYLSGVNNELMVFEKGLGMTRTVYGRGYERLGQSIVPETDAVTDTATNARAVLARTATGNAYFQSDMLGSPLFATNARGEVLRYAQRSIWGDVKLPVNRVDPTGEIPQIAAGALIGSIAGGAFGFVGSAASQLISGNGINWGKAIGAAANGALVGGVRGAVLATGAPVVNRLVSFSADFIGGTLESVVEQKINRGKVDFADSIVNGLTNAVSGAILGNKKITSAKNAFGRGFAAGAATAGIRNVYDAVRNNKTPDVGNAGSAVLGGLARIPQITPYAQYRDPKTICGVQYGGGIQYGLSYGYQYVGGTASQNVSFGTGGKQNGFSLKNFFTDMLVGGVSGGLATMLFHKGDTAVAVRKSGVYGNAGSLKSKYTTAIDDKVTMIAKDDLDPTVIKTFTDGEYRTVITNEDIMLYRVYGGRANKTGNYWTTSRATTKAETRVCSALLPEWENTMNWETRMIVPRGIQLNIGTVEKQVMQDGTILSGGADQILLPRDWDVSWIDKSYRSV